MFETIILREVVPEKVGFLHLARILLVLHIQLHEFLDLQTLVAIQISQEVTDNDNCQDENQNDIPLKSSAHRPHKDEGYHSQGEE